MGRFLFEDDSADQTRVVPGGPSDVPEAPPRQFLFEEPAQIESAPVLDQLKKSPDAEAETDRLSRETGIDPSAVRENPEAAKQQKRIRDIDRNTADTPVTRRFMSNPANTRLAHDDVENLSAIERLGRAFDAGRLTTKLGHAASELRDNPKSPALQARVNELKNQLAIKGADDGGGFVGWLTAASKVLGQQAESFTTPAAAARIGVGGSVGAAAGFAGGPLAPVTVPGGAIAGLGAGALTHVMMDSYAVEGGHAYLGMLDQGIEPEIAAPISHVVGVVNAALETGGAAVVLKPFGNAAKSVINRAVKKELAKEGTQEIMRKAIKAYGYGIVAEVSTETMQEMVTITGEEIAKRFTEEELKSITPEEAGKRIAEVAVETFQAMSVLAAPGPGMQFAANTYESRRAVKNEEVLTDMHEAIQESKLAERANELLEDHVSEVMVENRQEEAFIPADQLSTWLESTGRGDEFVAELDLANEIQEGLALGGDIQMTPKQLTKLMANENFPGLAQHVRMGPEALTAFEARELEESNLSETIEEIVNRTQAIQLDENVDIAENELGLKQFFVTAEEAGMTPVQYENYLVKVQKAADTAANRAAEKGLRKEQRELEREHKKLLARESERVTAELKAKPVYSAMDRVGRPKFPKEQVEPILKEMGFELGILHKRNTKMNERMYSTNPEQDTIDVEIYAEAAGYENAREMLEDVITSPPLKEEAARLTRENVAKEIGEFGARRGEILAAREALHNNDQAAVLQAELHALQEATGQKRTQQRLLKIAARNQIAKTTVKDVSPNKFLVAQRKLARQASRALKKGDRDLATQLKFQQALNFAMAQESYRIQSKIGKQKDFMAKFLRKSKSHQKMPVQYLQAIRELLHGVSFDPRLSDKSRKNLEALLKSPVDTAQIDPKLLDRLGSVNYQDLSYTEFLGLFNTVKELEHKGKATTKLRKARDKREVALVSAFMSDAARSNLSTKASDIKDNRNAWDKAKDFGSAIQTLSLTMDTIVRDMDGRQDLGVVAQNTKGLIDQAMSKGYNPGQVGYLRRSRAEGKALSKLYKNHFSEKEIRQFRDKIEVPGVTRVRMTQERVLAALLNSGNRGNMEAMLENTFTQEEVTAIHEFASKRDWEFAQATWDYLDSFWPEIQEATARRTNREVEQVQAVPVETQHGTFRGGYYPISYNRKESARGIFSPQNADQFMDEIRGGVYVASHTNQGHLQARTNPGVAPLRLDTGVIAGHVDRVIYDLEMSDAITDFYKIWYDQDFRATMDELGYSHYWEAGNLWLQDVVSGEIIASSKLESGLRHVRTGFTISKLGLNLSVAMIQPLGLIQASVQVGRGHMFNGVRRFMASKWKGENSVFAWVESQSGFMEARQDSWNKDVQEATRSLSNTFLKRVLPEKVNTFARDSLFFPIRMSQRLVDTITWLAAYEKGLKQFQGDRDKAVELGDRMVSRTQGSGLFSERSSFERGTISSKVRQTELVKIWTTLISYFVAKGNIAFERTRATKFRTWYKNPGQVISWASDMAMLFVVETLLAGVLTGQMPDSDSDEPFAKWLFEETLGTVMAGLPLLREIGSEVRGFPSGGVAGSVARDFGKVWKSANADEVGLNLLKAMNNLGGVWFHYPSAQANKLIQNAADATDRGKLISDETTLQEWIMGPQYDQ